MTTRARAGRGTVTMTGALALLAALAGVPVPAQALVPASETAPRAPVTVWLGDVAASAAVPVLVRNGRVGSPVLVENPQTSAFSPDGRTVWFTGSGDLALTPVDTEAGETGPSANIVTFGPLAISADGATAWVGDNDQEGGEVLQRVRLSTREVTDVGLGGGGAHDLALTPDGRSVFLSGYLFDGRRGLLQVATRTGELVRYLPDATPGALAMAPDGRTLYAMLASGVVEVDVATGARGRVLAPSARDLAVSPGGRTLWLVTDAGVLPVDLETGRAGRPVPGTTRVGQLEMAPSGDRALVNVYSEARTRLADLDLVQRSVDLLPVEQNADTFAVSPSQAPVAALAAQPAAAGEPTLLDASGSAARTGKIVRYDWRFGDGTTRTTGFPRVRHTYAAPGTYRAVLTVTDSTGTSTTRVFTGRQVLRNGGPTARTSRSLTVS